MANKLIEKQIIDRSIANAISSNASSIRSHAFRGCTNLPSASFPNATSIGISSFIGCTNLSELHIEKVTSFNAFNPTRITPETTKVYFGVGLTFIASTSGIYSFAHTASDTPLFSMTSWPAQGSNKETFTYTIYTDNATIKDGCLARANQYTTVNVYHIDGSAWEE